ncbi:MAG: diaminopimelate decarboxylase [Chloroflexi bacterium]|nr:diaminopimelate decarboxylase [Chloroflexota bacterium]
MLQKPEEALWRGALALFPDTANINEKGHLTLGGCDTQDLAREFGTPLYIFDEATLRSRCSLFIEEFARRYPETQVIYAAKAFLCQTIALILKEEGLGLDVVSGGEMAAAHSVAFPMERVYFHGNNKAPGELRLALDWGVGRVVVDNFHELALLNSLARDGEQDIWLRLSPGIDPHTHGHTTTGILDSKFGFSMATGQAEEAVSKALAAPHLRLKGLHVHLGSPVYELEPYREAVEVVLPFAAAMKERHGFFMEEFSPGGGYAITYTEDKVAPPIGDYAAVIATALKEEAATWDLPLPRLVVEPGRAIVGPAGVALYTVGSIKDIPGIRRYVSVDGGMGDNIRPPLYGSRYQALVANKAASPEEETVTLAGRFCESGDVLIRDIALPELSPGDLVALPGAGAYCIPMASNYNMVPRPAIVLVFRGEARLIRRRETYEDLLNEDYS